jgi:MFS family permease
MYDGVNRLASLVGAPVAGVLVAATSALGVLAIDAATFALSALLVVTFVRRSAEPARRNEDGEHAYLSQLREGLAQLCFDRLLLGIAVMVLVTNFVDQATGAVMLPVWARHVAHSPVALGLVGGAQGLGAVIGSLVVIWLGPRMPRRTGYSVGFLVAGAPRLIALAFAGSVSPVLPIVFLAGLGAGAINPVLGAVEYERIPRQLQARVLGALGAIAWAGIPLGSLAGGGAVSAFGLRTALLGGAGIYLLTTLAPFVFPTWRDLDQRALPVSESTAVTDPGGPAESLMPTP